MRKNRDNAKKMFACEFLKKNWMPPHLHDNAINFTSPHLPCMNINHLRILHPGKVVKHNGRCPCNHQLFDAQTNSNARMVLAAHYLIIPSNFGHPLCIIEKFAA